MPDRPIGLAAPVVRIRSGVGLCCVSFHDVLGSEFPVVMDLLFGGSTLSPIWNKAPAAPWSL